MDVQVRLGLHDAVARMALAWEQEMAELVGDHFAEKHRMAGTC
jgi:hypothetical protein